MQKFISCDWGTSSLRLKVIDADKMFVLAESTAAQGISATYELWKESDKKEDERVPFYQSILTEHIRIMELHLNFSLNSVPLIISGMVSSNMGMTELSYKEVPFGTDGHDLNIKTIEPNDNFKHAILMISGAKTTDDVMRGEETQLIGCQDVQSGKEDQVLIFPGTHSKHIMVKKGKVVDFETYLTGELFDLLSKKSVLSNTIEENQDLSVAGTLESFEKGVEDSLHTNILHSSFLVRTNYLLGKVSKKENYCYLSGLLIGTELKEIITNKKPLTVVSDESLNFFYNTALRKLGMDEVRYQDAGKALMEGHRKMYNLYKSTLAAGQPFQQ